MRLRHSHAFALFMFIVISSLAGCGSPQLQPPANPSEPGRPAPPDLELVLSTGTVDSVGIHITGKIRNNSPKEYTYVQVTFRLYDEAGNQTGNALANIANLEPHGTWSFDAVGFGGNHSKFKLDKITGF